MGDCPARPRVLLLCSPCMGHFIPFVELARRLVADHGLAVTLLYAAATSPPSEQYLALAAFVPASVDLVALPAPAEDDATLPPLGNVRDRVNHAIRFSVPQVREVATAAAPLAALVVDLGFLSASGVAAELGVPFYLFFMFPWMALSLFLHLPELDAGRGPDAGEYRHAAEPIRLPGCVPIHAQDLSTSLLADRSSDTFAGFLALGRSIPGLVDGILVNTFHELEPAVGHCTVDGLKLPPIHPVGPMVWTRPVLATDRSHECLRWLDKQPRGSVVYVSFGSGGTLTLEQTTELALGLELSRCRFIWAAKTPHQTSAVGAFFGSQTGGEGIALDFLPEGFVERTREVGLVMNSPWAPQTAILEHASVGCFVTHCGWNSVLESVVNGVPMVAWPLYAEQKMNATMLEGQMKVATRVKVVGADRLVSREEVVNAIRRVMEGDEAERIRKQASELKLRSVHALSESGCSTLALAQTADKWRRCFDDGK